MKCCRFCAYLILLFIAYGCEYVKSPYLIGDKPAVTSPEQWSGKWSIDGSGKEIVQIEVVDKDKGIVRLTTNMTGNKDELEGPYECYLREAGKWMFANVRDGADFHPLRIVKEENKIIFWMPDHDKFKALVEKGVLPGEVQGNAVRLGLLKPEHLDIIISEKEGALYSWDRPMFLIRYREKDSAAGR